MRYLGIVGKEGGEGGGEGGQLVAEYEESSDGASTGKGSPRDADMEDNGGGGSGGGAAAAKKAEAAAAAAAAAHAAHAAQQQAEAEAAAAAQEEEEEEDEFNPYLFIKSLPPYAEVVTEVREVCLPKKTRQAPRISLVLDLDETLVHCSVDAVEKADLTFPVDFNGQVYEVHVRKRPNMDRFLETVSKHFEVREIEGHTDRGRWTVVMYHMITFSVATHLCKL